jgi:hypothetical protein
VNIDYKSQILEEKPTGYTQYWKIVILMSNLVLPTAEFLPFNI